MAVISLKKLLEAGSHFGHNTNKWNPKMSKYIFEARGGVHIIDLDKTVECINEAYKVVHKLVKSGKSILFIGKKAQAKEAIKDEALRAGMFYLNERWLGGTLTNFKTIRTRIDYLNKLNRDEQMGQWELLPKKEVVKLRKERDSLELIIGGIKDMRSLPAAVFIVDLRSEHIAVKEARSLGITTIGLVDTNCDPDLVDYAIPGNDDAVRAVQLVASVIADACVAAKEGLEELPNSYDEDGDVSEKDFINEVEKKDKDDKKAAILVDASLVNAEEDEDILTDSDTTEE
jgi:small subunit ribosomal protein S2